MNKKVKLSRRLHFLPLQTTNLLLVYHLNTEFLISLRVSHLTPGNHKATLGKNNWVYLRFRLIKPGLLPSCYMVVILPTFLMQWVSAMKVTEASFGITQWPQWNGVINIHVRIKSINICKYIFENWRLLYKQLKVFKTLIFFN